MPKTKPREIPRRPPYDTTVTVRLPSEVFYQLQRIAYDEDRKHSSVARMLIVAGLAQRADSDLPKAQ